ncbi:MAG: hypothetical protein QOF36_2561 [Microbacteriaceae bacterium]|nr:hypothetical protein [Microbacteriaceae bacterium]
MIRRWLNWRLKRTEDKLSATLVLLDGMERRADPHEYALAEQDVSRLRCHRARLLDMLDGDDY